jgi:hypothetical protein
MPLYRTWLIAESALALPGPIDINYPGVNVRVTNVHGAPTPGAPLAHAGLKFQVTTSAADPRDALNRSVQHVFPALDLLSLAHVAAIDEPLAFLAIEWETGTHDRPIGQIHRDIHISHLVRRPFRPDVFEAFHRAFDQLESNRRDRLQRAVHLFRRSHSETDNLNRFEDIWGGLEALNPLLIDKYALPDTYPGATCPECGAQIQVPGRSSGIRHAILTLTDGTQTDWKDVLDLRNGIAHSRKPLGPISLQADRLLPLLGRALIAAVLDLAGIPTAFHARSIRPPLPIARGISCLVTAVLLECPLDILDVDGLAMPHFTVAVTEHHSTGDPGVPGQRRFSFTLSATAQALPVLARDTMVEALVHKDPEDDTATFNVTEVAIRPP